MMDSSKCQSCEGYGYDSFDTTTSQGDDVVEIQRNDGCKCLSARTGLDNPGDKEAVDLYEQDLKEGIAWALRCKDHLAESLEDLREVK